MHESIEPPTGDLSLADLSHPDGRRNAPPNYANRPRKPWLALLLAIVCSPAAFAYVGRYAWCVAISAVLIVAVAGAGWIGWLQTLAGIWTIIGLAVALQIGSIALVWFFARSQRRAYRSRWYNRWYAYPFLIATIGIPTVLLFANRESALGYATYRIPSGSMAPTVDVGDLIVVDTRPSTLRSLHVGDIVITDSIRRPDERNLRRIVAMGGQHVLVNAAGLQVDDVLQSHAHQRGSDLMQSNFMVFPDVDLGPDEFYLMGDNRGNSFDSRTEGPYSRSQIHGKATAIWWSSDPQRLGAFPSP